MADHAAGTDKNQFGEAGAVLKEVGFELDHLGVAVKSLDEGFQFYKALGFQDMPIEEVPTEKVRVGFLNLGNRASIELLEATSDESPIAKFIEKRGPGIHHVCLRVKEIDQVAARLKSSGIRLINETPRPGAHGCRVVFVHPASTGGVLLELSEPGLHASGS
jgi:methylmalonyl-CoA/ethylmalonyl-CoA epimerase